MDGLLALSLSLVGWKQGPSDLLRVPARSHEMNKRVDRPIRQPDSHSHHSHRDIQTDKKTSGQSDRLRWMDGWMNRWMHRHWERRLHR